MMNLFDKFTLNSVDCIKPLSNYQLLTFSFLYLRVQVNLIHEVSLLKYIENWKSLYGLRSKVE